MEDSFKFTFDHLADAFIQSDLQIRRTVEAIKPNVLAQSKKENGSV